MVVNPAMERWENAVGVTYNRVLVSVRPVECGYSTSVFSNDQTMLEIGSITSRCSGKEPAGRDADQTRESGGIRAYARNRFLICLLSWWGWRGNALEFYVHSSSCHVALKATTQSRQPALSAAAICTSLQFFYPALWSTPSMKRPLSIQC